ncbi:MAG: fasciclin domain-containing protein [Gemmatimonadales bacterium]|jgi:uncharacterized surface protein with fasciclin (FAS1) repeats
MRKHRLSTFVALAAIVGFAAPASAQYMSSYDNEKDIVETAVSAGSFQTLVAAVQAAGLVETLQGEGPFTVFAPTDEAFAKLPAGTVEDLLKEENREQLIAVLTYHVVPGKLLAEDVLQLESAESAQGQSVHFSLKDGEAFIDDARIIKTDIEASNGVIHVIDSVILPKSE